jgi:hypothetical protein
MRTSFEPAKPPFQLTVTRRGAQNWTRQHPLSEWEFGYSRFNDQKRSKMNAIAMAAIRHRYGWGQALSTAWRAKRGLLFPQRTARMMPGVQKADGRLRKVRKLAFATACLFP